MQIPNPEKQFVLAGVTEFSELSTGLADNGARNGGVLMRYRSLSTATTRPRPKPPFGAAQLSHDIGIPGSILIYSWPSRATKGTGYAYDLDSMLFARDGLEQTIRSN